MISKVYKYRFPESIQVQEIVDTLLLAKLAVERLYCRPVRLESMFILDEVRRTCVVDASTEVGRALARIFAGFATKEYGEHSVKIERIQQDSTHTMEGVRHD